MFFELGVVMGRVSKKGKKRHEELGDENDVA